MEYYTYRMLVLSILKKRKKQGEQEMKTTLNKIREHGPCVRSWNKLLESLGKSSSDDESLDLMTILESNGIKDAVWCLRCFDYYDYCLFLADVAESALPIYEEKYPDNLAPRNCIEDIRQYHSGDITIGQLNASAGPAASAAAYAASATAYASASAAYAATYAANAVANAVDAVNAAADAADAAYTAARKQKWQEIEELFIKHFGKGE